jgi:hypothetical protein
MSESVIATTRLPKNPFSVGLLPIRDESKLFQDVAKLLVHEGVIRCDNIVAINSNFTILMASWEPKFSALHIVRRVRNGEKHKSLKGKGITVAH